MKPLFIGEPVGDKDFAWIYNALKEVIRLSQEQVQILAGAGLTGGGALGEDQTLNVGAGTGITVTDDAVSLAAIAAWTLLANATGSSAAPTGVGINDLTEKTTLVGDDLVLIADSAASFALKKAKRSNVDTAFALSNDSVTNAILANMATQTIKGRTTAGTGDPEDLTVTQVTAMLNAFVGDSGSGGTKGLVPAPAAGDAAAGKFLKADGTFAVPPSGAVLQCLQTTYTTNANLTALLPADDTTPQSTEGTEVLSLSITPSDNTNKVLVLVHTWGSGAVTWSAALFRGTTCINATSMSNANDTMPQPIVYLDSPASASAQTYSVRVGPGTAAQIVRLNGTTSARLFGGTAACTLTLMEIAA